MMMKFQGNSFKTTPRNNYRRWTAALKKWPHWGYISPSFKGTACDLSVLFVQFCKLQ